VVFTAARTVSFTGTWQALPVATMTMPSTASTADLLFTAPAFPVASAWHLDDVSAACGAEQESEPAPAPGLSGHWMLDEVSGTTAVDSSGNGNDGTSYHTTGDGQGYTFNGTDSRVVVPDASRLDPTTADFSSGVTLQMAAPPVVGETFDVLRKGTTHTAGGYYKLEIIHLNGKAVPRCAIKDGSKTSVSMRGASQSIADNRPHAITCRRVGNSVTILVDALAPRTATVSRLGSISNDVELGVGAKPEDNPTSGFDWFEGVLLDAWVGID
jgi:hypothetical protein